MTKTLWLLACFGILSACSCNKKQVEPAFQNSFSCKINGVDWKPEGGTNSIGAIRIPSINITKHSFANSITIDALKDVRDEKTGKSVTYEGLRLTPVNLEVDKIQPIFGFAFYQYGDNSNGCDKYYLDSMFINTVKVISIDYTLRRVKGVFEFSATSPYCRQTLKITEGKFEVKY